MDLKHLLTILTIYFFVSSPGNAQAFPATADSVNDISLSFLKKK